MYRKGLIIMMVLFGLASFFGCDKGSGKKPDESALQSFSYSYNGTSRDSIYSYSLNRLEDGGAEFVYETLRFQEEGDIIVEADESILDRIRQLYLKHKAYKWNGYNKSNPNVLDGSSFSEYMDFEDGGSLSIQGSNSRPNGYGAFEDEFEELIRPLIEKAVEKVNNRRMEKGVSGSLQYVMINFMQQGDSGEDKYEILLSHQREGRKNFDVRIYSVSGEFIEPGKYNYYYDIPDEDIGFDEIRAILERHDLIRWYGWDKAAEDYNNSEWFQISFSFEEGDISAMGTAHPEGYDEFRKEILEYIVQMIRNAEEKHSDFRSRDI